MSDRSFNRILCKKQYVSTFLRSAFGIDEYLSPIEFEKICSNIASVELQIIKTIGEGTLVSKSHRDADVSSDFDRKELRSHVLDDLISKTRLENDDKISMGRGGALPNSVIKRDSQAFIIIGLPASGKSEVTNLLSDKYGAVVLDSDYAKRKFPEYKLSCGASIVHDESSAVVFGDKIYCPDENSLLKMALKNEYNIVIPKIGSSKKKIDSLCKYLMEDGYSVHLLLVRLDRQKSVLRAITRYQKTKRYIPISMIFDTYSNEPTITFYDILNFGKNFASYTMISSDVSLGSPKEILYCTKNSPISESDFQKHHN